MSKDKHTAYAVLIVKSMDHINDELFKTDPTRIKTPAGMTVELGGETTFC